MALSDKNKKWLRENCINFLYAFIPEASLKYFTKYSNVIATKRLNQIWTLENMRKKANVTYREVESQVANYIKDIYGRTPEDILIALANGESVGGKNWRKGIYGIGALGLNISIQEFLQTSKYFNFKNGYEVNPFTGDIIDNNGEVVSTSNSAWEETINETLYTYRKNFNSYNRNELLEVSDKIVAGSSYQGKKISLTSKAVILNDISGKKIVMYAVDTQTSGDTVIDSNGKEVSAENGSVWGNSASWESILDKIIEFLKELFGIDSPKKENTVINQKVDGFSPIVDNKKSSGTSFASLGLLAGGLLLAVNMGDDKKKGKKKGKR